MQASYRADFTMQQLSKEMELVIDRLWPSYENAAKEAGFPVGEIGTELVLGGWSPNAGRMVATAYAKNQSAVPAVVQRLEGGLASPGEPLEGRADSFAPEAVLAASWLQARWLNDHRGRKVAGGRVLAAVLRQGQRSIQDLGRI